MVVEGWGCFNLGHPLSNLLAKIPLRRLGGFATFPIQSATLEIQLQLPFVNYTTHLSLLFWVL